MALLLRKRGITRVRPLAGGLGGWRERGYPLAPYAVPQPVAEVAAVDAPPPSN